MAQWEREYPAFADWLGKRLSHAPYSQAWLADKLDLTAPLISDWCNGKKVPYRAIHIALIARYLDADPVEVATLAQFEDIPAVLEKDAFLNIQYSQWPTMSEFLQAMKERIGFAHEDLITGRPSRAKNTLDTVIEQTEERLNYELRLGDQRKKRKPLNRLRRRLANAYNERVWTQHSLSSKAFVLDDTASDFRRVMALVGELEQWAYGDTTPLRVASVLKTEAKSLRADSYYIAGNWQSGVRFASEVVGSIEDNSPLQVASLQRSIRCLLLCSAFLGEFATDTQKTVLTMLDNGIVTNLPDRASLWESIGRVNALYGSLDEATRYFDAAEQDLEQSERRGLYVPSFVFQVIRARLNALTLVPAQYRDFDYALHLAKEALRIARAFKYKRFCKQIVDLIWQLGIGEYLKDDLEALPCDTM